MIYTATITSTPLRLRDMRIVAGMLLDGVTDKEWDKAILEDNVLQTGSTVGVRRSSNILRARLLPLGEGLWRMLRDGGSDLAVQAALAGAIKHSRLLGDFMDLTMRDQRLLFAARLEPQMWTDFIEGCRGRDPDMPHWSAQTVAKLRSVVFSVLAEAGYLENTRTLRLQTVFVERELSGYLRDRGEKYVLRCLEVAE